MHLDEKEEGIGLFWIKEGEKEKALVKDGKKKRDSVTVYGNLKDNCNYGRNKLKIGKDNERMSEGRLKNRLSNGHKKTCSKGGRPA